MKIAINRDGAVPIHDQLVSQLALRIATGEFAPGERLPSIRGLAQRVGVHPNTMLTVYKTLEAYGIVAARAGSGVRVIEATGASAAAAVGEGGIGALAARFVAQARAAGHEVAAIRQAFDRALSPARPGRLVIVDPHPDFHPLYLVELAALGLPVAVVAFDALAGLGPDDALATSMYHIGPLRAALGPDRPVHVFPVSAGSGLLAELASLPAGATVALVSVSSTMRRMGREILTAQRGDGLLVLEVDPADADAVAGALRLADLVVADGVCHDGVARGARKPVRRFQLIPDAARAALAAALCEKS